MKSDRRKRPHIKGAPGARNRHGRGRPFGDGAMRGNNGNGGAHPEAMQVSRKPPVPGSLEGRVFLKFLHEDERHGNFQWKTGKNSARCSMRGKADECEGKGLYFCDADHAYRWLDTRVHRWVRRVFPDPAATVLGKEKLKAGFLVAEERKDLWRADTWEWMSGLCRHDKEGREALMGSALFFAASRVPALRRSLLDLQKGCMCRLIGYLGRHGMSTHRKRELALMLSSQVTLASWKEARVVYPGLGLGRPGIRHLLGRAVFLVSEWTRALRHANDNMAQVMDGYGRG